MSVIYIKIDRVFAKKTANEERPLKYNKHRAKERANKDLKMDNSTCK